MAKTVVGLFDTLNEAQSVVQQLIDAGFDRNEISILANDARGEFTRANAVGETSSTAEGAGAGAVGGGVLGGVLGLLVGIGALAIPGIGPVLAAGPLAAALGTAGASTLVGAGIGAAAGGVIGALVGAGIPEEDASFYAEGVRRGGTLVMVKTADDTSQRAYDLMRSAGAVDIDKRSGDLRSTGWTGFNPDSGTYTGDNAWERSSKVGTAGGAVAGAATGAAIGAVGGPVGMAIGGAAGAVTGAGIGAAGDAAAETAAESNDDTTRTTNYSTSGTSSTGSNYGSNTTSTDSSYDADSAAASSNYGTGSASTTNTYGTGSTLASDTNSDSSFYDSSTAGATTTPGRNTSLQNDQPIAARQGQVDYDASTSTAGSTTDRTYGNDLGSKWEESSKVGTAGGAVAGAATGAAIGAVGGPVGMAVGGVAGAVTGAGVGAVGDAAGEAAEDSFRGYDEDFRTHYQSYGTNSGYTYDQYSPIYRYGYNLANDAAYRDREWDDIETDARTRWEERNPGTWDRFKDSVRYAWDKARGAR